ncbi:MAG: hypothetical protein ACI9GW_001271 [Halieaceae bacterium]|jgi:hypothetical protein
MSDLALSVAIENLLVSRNLRGMGDIQGALEPGYYLRAAQMLYGLKGAVIIGTGFPVIDTFETDGPVGAIALHDVLAYLGAKPLIACGEPLATRLMDRYPVLELSVGNSELGMIEARQVLLEIQPEAVVSIERPGLSAEGRYYNMRGEDITPRCAFFDYVIQLAECPTIGIGDGGNEIGMGNVRAAIERLDIVPAVTTCDELLIADVSNWGAYGIIAMLSHWQQEDLLSRVSPREILSYLSARGSVDGVSRENTLTEDGLEADNGERLIGQLRTLVEQY